MARWKTIVLSALVLLLLVLAGGIQAVVGWRALLFGPKARALTSRTFEATPERLERGRYLAVARHGCVFCHSERDCNAPGAPPRADRLGAGVVWAAEGMPWLTAPNLTPDPETGIGRASDDAIARAIREGIGEYVLRTSACHHCHTPMDARGQLDMGARHGGRQPVSLASGHDRRNQPTKEATGIANYDEATFVTVMKTGKLGTLHAMMPWVVYAG